ncbi:NADPH-dependent oxidoreductase [Aerococcaceae bacterium DSM 111020]|nr:NADPH-dependent oxidoreductase [Aerococcaceae bacterium DSM 111020]
MTETIKHQLNHRTIRFFEDRAIKPEDLDQLWDVMNRTATSNGLQASSIIRVTDPQIKDDIAKVCNQFYVADLPELYIFIVDSRRIQRIAEEKNYKGDEYRSMDFFFKGFTDGALMAQNLTNAIESLGLGAVYLGSILNDPQTMIDILGLPELTFPVLGLGFGYPNDNPEKKPRMKMELKLHENGYTEPDSYMEALAEYDQEMTHYYDTRQKNQRSDTYTDQVTRALANVPEKRAKIMQVVERQGFDLKLNNGND